MAEFGVFRGTVRHAVAVLVTDGLVHTVARRGSYVLDASADTRGHR